MIETLASLPIDQFATAIWGQLALAGIGAFSKYKQGKADEKFKQKQLDLQNQEARDRWNMQDAERMAMIGASMKQAQGQAAAGRARLNSQRDAFGLTKESEEAEQNQRDKFAKAMADFSQKNKKANLTEAKAKRSGRASKAAKGAKVSGTAGRAGRLSGAFRSGAKSAVTAGLNEAATTAGMQAALRGYGADLDRERGMFADLAGEGAVVGEQAKRLDQLGALRERLGNREYSALMDQASAGYLRDSTAASLLNRPGPAQTYGGSPDYGVWGKVGDIANIGATAYGMGAFNKAPTGQGYTYGSGSPFPKRYVGMPSNPKNYNTHPGY